MTAAERRFRPLRRATKGYAPLDGRPGSPGGQGGAYAPQKPLSKSPSTRYRTIQGLLLSNFHPGMRYCIPTASFRAPRPWHFSWYSR